MDKRETMFHGTDTVFHALIHVPSHLTKKNNRPIHLNRASGKRFLGKGNELRKMEQYLLLKLLQFKREYRITTPMAFDLQATFLFYFVDYYAASHKQRRKNLPDLSNLIELPQDILQKAQIIENDSQIVSLDGSRRLPGNDNILEIWLFADKD